MSLPGKLRSLLLQRIPIFQWAPNYDTHKLVSDMIAGITVGLTVMPQGLAYATLAGLEPQVSFSRRGERSVSEKLGNDSGASFLSSARQEFM